MASTSSVVSTSSHPLTAIELEVLSMLSRGPSTESIILDKLKRVSSADGNDESPKEIFKSMQNRGLFKVQNRGGRKLFSVARKVEAVVNAQSVGKTRSGKRIRSSVRGYKPGTKGKNWQSRRDRAAKISALFEADKVKIEEALSSRYQAGLIEFEDFRRVMSDMKSTSLEEAKEGKESKEAEDEEFDPADIALSATQVCVDILGIPHPEKSDISRTNAMLYSLLEAQNGVMKVFEETMEENLWFFSDF